MSSIRRVFRAGVALALLSGVMHARAAQSLSNPDIDPGSVLEKPAPGFQLRDQSGRSRSLAQLRGKVVLLAFVDPNCESICPLTTESMRRALSLLGPAALRVQLVGINANPLATSVADVAAYTRAHHMEERWWFLTGPEAALAHVWRAYGVFIASVDGDIDHQPLIVLIDRRGRERKLYFTQMSYGGLDQQAEVLAEGIAPLLPGHVIVRHPVSLRYLPPPGPYARVHLPAFGRSSGNVLLGPAQPHLLLFFASWLSGATLPAKLGVLDRYAAIARRQGWPEAVAVDELPTEAPTVVWRRRLSRLASALREPIAVDQLGHVADGYGVHDLPWFVLTASGRILWQHDGWLSFPALAAQVRAALNGGAANSGHAGIAASRRVPVGPAVAP